MSNAYKYKGKWNNAHPALLLFALISSTPVVPKDFRLGPSLDYNKIPPFPPDRRSSRDPTLLQWHCAPPGGAPHTLGTTTLHTV